MLARGSETPGEIVTGEVLDAPIKHASTESASCQLGHLATSPWAAGSELPLHLQHEIWWRANGTSPGTMSTGRTAPRKGSLWRGRRQERATATWAAPEHI